MKRKRCEILEEIKCRRKPIDRRCRINIEMKNGWKKRRIEVEDNMKERGVIYEKK